MRNIRQEMQHDVRRNQIEKAEGYLLADPTRPKRLAEFQRLLTELQNEAQRKGLDKATLREINAEVASVRRKAARTKKKKPKQAAG